MFEISEGVYKGNEPRFIIFNYLLSPNYVICLSAMTTEQLKTQSNNIIHKKKIKNLRKNRDHLIYKITFILLLIKSVTITMPKEN